MAQNICIIGAGSWGTALALTACRAGQYVTLVSRLPEQAIKLAEDQENRHHLPGARFPANLTVTSNLASLRQADTVFQVTPAQSFRETCRSVQEDLPSHIPWVICAKGMLKGNEGKTPQLLSQASQALLPNPVVILSGPSFASEVGQNLPTAVTVASADEGMAKSVAGCLRHLYFRCYVSNDPMGVQVAGAVKNVLAIACGIARGKKLGNNAAAALMTRGLAEMRRLGEAMGASTDTFSGLAGMGDVTLTCSSEQSRNTQLGKLIGENPQNIGEILMGSSLTEGVPTVEAVFEFSRKLSVAMPICQAVYSLLYKRVPVEQLIEEILSRQPKWEL